MLRFVRLVLLIPIAVFVAVLALANRQALTLSFDPFQPDAPAVAITAPVFVILFATLILGIVVGGVAAWLSQGKWRREARTRGQEAAALRRQASQRLPELGSTGQALSLRR